MCGSHCSYADCHVGGPEGSLQGSSCHLSFGAHHSLVLFHSFGSQHKFHLRREAFGHVAPNLESPCTLHPGLMELHDSQKSSNPFIHSFTHSRLACLSVPHLSLREPRALVWPPPAPSSHIHSPLRQLCGQWELDE